MYIYGSCWNIGKYLTENCWLAQSQKMFSPNLAHSQYFVRYFHSWFWLAEFIKIFYDNLADWWYVEEVFTKYWCLAEFWKMFSQNIGYWYFLTCLPSNQICCNIFSFLSCPEFELEPHQECAYDHIVVYDGHTTTQQILGRYSILCTLYSLQCIVKMYRLKYIVLNDNY